MRCIVDAYAEKADEVAVERLCRDLGLGGLPNKTRNYPAEIFNRLVEEGGKRFWPWERKNKVYFLQGKKAFQVFAESLIGKVGMSLSGGDLKKIASSAHKFLERTVNSGKVNYVDTGENTCRLEYRNFLTSAHYHHGLLVAAAEVLAPGGQIEMKLLKQENPKPGVFRTDVDFLIKIS
jgi:uncharacterized protein (TIGR02265 family)